MRNLLLLIKLRLNEAFSISKLRYSKDASLKVEIILLYIFKLLAYATIFILFYFGYKYLVDSGYRDIIPIISYLLSGIASIFITVVSINGLIGGNQDSEFLLSTPIASFNHVIVLFLTLYFRCFVAVSFLMIPMMIAYNDLANTFNFIVGLLLTSLPFSGISSLIGMVVVLTLAKNPKKDQIYSCLVLILTLIVAALVVLFISLSYMTVNDNKDVCALISLFISNIKFARMYQYAIVDYHFGYRTLFIGLSLIWYIFFFLFLTVTYRFIVIALKTPVEYKKYELKEVKKTNLRLALFKRELKNNIRSKSYLTKSLVYLVFGFVLVNGLVIFDKLLVEAIGTIKLLGIIFLIISLANSSYKSYNEDGKEAWILESAGISSRSSILSKLISSLIFLLPFSIITGLLTGIMLNSAILIVIPTIYAVAITFISLLLSYRFRKESNPSIPFILGYLPFIVISLAFILI